MALFVSGFAGSLGVSSFITTFVTGFVFSYDGYFVKENEEAHVQEVIDMLVNLTFFIFFGAIIPWAQFTTQVTFYRLILATLVLFFVRRLPIVLLLAKFTDLDLTFQEQVFLGWFGPIGVGALWYVAFFLKIFPPSLTPPAAYYPAIQIYFPIIAFIVLTSVVVHGITLPFIHMTLIGIRIRTMSRENVQSVPMWPQGMPLEINMIGAPFARMGTGQSCMSNGLGSPILPSIPEI